MRFFPLFVLLTCCMQLMAESWFGFCIIEANNKSICSEAQARRGDFSPICDSFAREEGASSWRARFSTDLSDLQHSMADYCDVVRDGGQGSLYACQLEALCPGNEQSNIKHLASRVYARQEQDAISACLEKEDWRYQQELRQHSVDGCFVRVIVEAMSQME